MSTDQEAGESLGSSWEKRPSDGDTEIPHAFCILFFISLLKKWLRTWEDLGKIDHQMETQAKNTCILYSGFRGFI